MQSSLFEQARRFSPIEGVLDDATSLLPNGAIVGVPTTVPKVALFGLDSGFFYLPLAHAVECGADESHVRDLGTTIAIGHAHFALLDKMLDDGLRERWRILLAHHSAISYLHRMESLYGANIDVHEAHLHYFDRYCRAQEFEAMQRAQLRPIRAEDVDALGEKSAPVCLALRGELCRSGAGDLTDQYDHAFLTICSGLQLLDDLADMVADFQNDLSSVPLNLLFSEGLGLTSWPSRSEVEPSRFHALAAVSGVSTAVVEVARGRFREGLRLAVAGGSRALEELAVQRLERTDERLRELEHLREPSQA